MQKLFFITMVIKTQGSAIAEPYINKVLIKTIKPSIPRAAFQAPTLS